MPSSLHWLFCSMPSRCGNAHPETRPAARRALARRPSLRRRLTARRVALRALGDGRLLERSVRTWAHSMSSLRLTSTPTCTAGLKLEDVAAAAAALRRLRRPRRPPCRPSPSSTAASGACTSACCWRRPWPRNVYRHSSRDPLTTTAAPRTSLAGGRAAGLVGDGAPAARRERPAGPRQRRALGGRRARHARRRGEAPLAAPDDRRRARLARACATRTAAGGGRGRLSRRASRPPAYLREGEAVRQVVASAGPTRGG